MRPTCASNSPTSSRIKTSAAIFCSARFQVCPELDHLANAMVGQASSLSLDSGYFSGADPRSARVPWTRSSGAAARPLAVFASPPLENRTELFDNRKAKGGEFFRKVKPSRNGTSSLTAGIPNGARKNSAQVCWPICADSQLGFEEWTRGLPEEDAEALVDPSAGTPVRWVPGKGWLSLSSQPGPEPGSGRG